MGAYQHYGSAGDDDVVYTTNTTSLYVTGDFYPDNDWEIALKGSYTVSTGEYEAIDVSLPEETVEIGDYDYTNVHTYSDLNIRQLDLSVRGERKITSRASVYLGLGFSDYTDDEPYVYGDQSGSVLYSHSGVRVLF